MSSNKAAALKAIEAYREALAGLDAMEWPALKVVTVKDDGETYPAVRCPWCKNIVEDDDLVAVDLSERWSRVDDLGETTIANGRVSLCSGDDDYDNTLYYLHLDGSCINPVSLPEGWTEDWK